MLSTVPCGSWFSYQTWVNWLIGRSGSSASALPHASSTAMADSTLMQKRAALRGMRGPGIRTHPPGTSVAHGTSRRAGFRWRGHAGRGPSGGGYGRGQCRSRPSRISGARILNTPVAELSSLVVLVTGGARGLGAAISRAFLGQGARVVVNYHRSADAAHALV